MSIQIGGEACNLVVIVARSSTVHRLVPILRWRVIGDIVTSNHSLSIKLTDDAEYHVVQHNRSCIPSLSKSIGSGGASAYPFLARNVKISWVEVNSMPINRAPSPTVRPFASVGTVRIISGAVSPSSWTTTGLVVAIVEHLSRYQFQKSPHVPNRWSPCFHQFSKSTCCQNSRQLSLQQQRSSHHRVEPMLGHWGAFLGQG